MNQLFFNLLTLILSLTTGFGVFLHDGRVDKAVLVSLKTSANYAISAADQSNTNSRLGDFLHSDAHTHPDHNAARGSLVNGLAYQSPSVPPRNDDKKHKLQAGELRGHYAFDNVNLPLITD